MKPVKKATRAKSKVVVKPARAVVPAGSKVGGSGGGVAEKSAPRSVRGKSGPDERRPDVKADEIYGDTKIPEHIRKH